MRRALIAFALFTGYYSAVMVSRVDSSIPGYGVSTTANGGDPFALLVGVIVAAVLVRLVRALTR